jgi:hypothetical protein
VNGCDIEMPDELTDENSDGSDEQNGEVQQNAESMAFGDDNLETYPNPYQNSFSINFRPEADDHITIDLYNPSGIKIRKVFEGSVQKSRLYNWSVELGELKDKVLILIINGKENYSFRKVVRK